MEEKGGLDGALGEGLPAMRHMLELDALPVPGEEDGMIADDIPAAHGMDADLTLGPRAHQTFAAVVGFFGKLHSMAARHGFRESQGGSARGILLLVMMGLDD